MRTWIAAALTAVLSLVCAGTAQAERIVTIGGDVTEIVFALGEGKRIVGVDQTSMYPYDATKGLPQVGYMRNLSAEGILSLKPDLVLAGANAGPPAVLEQLGDAKIKLVKVPGEESMAGVLAKIDVIAGALDVADKAKALKASVERRMAAVDAGLKSVGRGTKAMFILSQGPGGTMAAGTKTAADAMIDLAHGTNVAKGFEGYKPLTPESAVALAPDVIIVAQHALDMMGGLDQFRQRPEVVVTPAARTNRIVVMDALLLLGFGPRTPEAVAMLARTFHPEAKIDTAEVKAN